MARDERLQLADEIAVPPEAEVRLEPPLERAHPELLEPRALRLRERLRCELGERGAAPELERGPVACRRLLRAAGVEARARLGREPLEAVQVELVRLELEGVPGRSRVQHPGRDHLPQLRAVDLHHLRGAVGHVLAPQLADDAVDRELAAGVHEQEREERPLLPAPQPDVALPLAQLQRTEDPKVHVAPCLAGDRTTVPEAIYPRITGAQSPSRLLRGAPIENRRETEC